MSEALYNFGGLRFWTEAEILARERICAQVADTVMRTLRGINQAWAFERVDTPLIIPRARLNPAYTGDDAFFLAQPMGDSEMVLRAETTDGSYMLAEHILRTTKTKAPFGVWQLGQSFRRETSDGANAANLRFNAFYQLEFQLIYSKPTSVEQPDGTLKLRGTQAPIPQIMRDALLPMVQKITGLDARIIPSDRLPPYSQETNDIEVFWHAPTKAEPEWKEVCSMSQRTDFPDIPGQKDPLTVFEIAFGADRLTAVTQGKL